MTLAEAKAKLEEYQRVSLALGHAAGVISYDGNTVAPKQSAKIRAVTQSELGRIEYELTTSNETEEMILTLREHRAELDEVTARISDELYRDFDRTRRIPKDLYVEYEKLCVESDDIWHSAKANDDFASFEPTLSKMFDMTKQIALCVEPDKDPYDTQLDMFERGLDTKTCDRFFATLKAGIVPLIEKVTASPYQIDEPLLRGNFPIPVQRDFSTYLMKLIGIDPERCIIGETEHPFTDGTTKYDVRITTHYHEDNVLSSMYSVIHEGGHALYELGISDELTMGLLGTGVSMGIHESQSRFYENIIGRSREFCGLILPWLKEHFPAQLGGLTEERLYRAVNASSPSLIRTEADELTYCLHVMIRYELERKMFKGDLTAKELPAAWNEMYKEYLGIDVPNDREGVLQDSHWSFGGIGYFPSYAIGSAYGAQFLEEMNKSFDVFEAVSKGEIRKISEWLKDRIWQYGCLFEPSDLFRRICGELRPEVFVNYLSRKYTELYRL